MFIVCGEGIVFLHACGRVRLAFFGEIVVDCKGRKRERVYGRISGEWIRRDCFGFAKFEDFCVRLFLDVLRETLPRLGQNFLHPHDLVAGVDVNDLPSNCRRSFAGQENAGGSQLCRIDVPF